ncbi:MAG: hypothetical protein GY850_46185 [bacterium]|nr:hypothetical protein [bacterium]
MNRLVRGAGLEYNFRGSRLPERVTARINLRPLPEALALLLRPVGYKATISGGAITIAHAPLPHTEKEFSGQLRIEVPLKYIDTEFAETFLEGLYPEPDDQDDKRFFSAMNPERNTVFLSGAVADVRIAAKLLEQADTDSGHVLIEVLAVEFDNEAFRDIGARIFDAAKDKLSGISMDFSSLAGKTISFTHIADALNVTQLSAVLNLLIEDQTARVIARPYLATLSNVEATLEISDNRFVIAQTPGGLDASVEQISSGMEMEIKPIVQVDGMIRLEIDVTQSKFNSGTGLSTTTNRVQTVMRVGDGETVIMGGLMLNAYMSEESGLPVLRDIPAVGALFGRKFRAGARRQAMIYVTPHLWTPGTTTPLLKKDHFLFH